MIPDIKKTQKQTELAKKKMIADTKKQTELAKKEMCSSGHLKKHVNWWIKISSSIGRSACDITVYEYKASDVRKIVKELVKAGYKVDLPELSSLFSSPNNKYYFKINISWG
jgi:hypothetical protein